jgi:hypothetical protein
MTSPRKYKEFAELPLIEYNRAVTRLRYAENKYNLVKYHQTKVPTGRPRGRPRKTPLDQDAPPPPKRPVGRPRKSAVLAETI